MKLDQFREFTESEYERYSGVEEPEGAKPLIHESESLGYDIIIDNNQIGIHNHSIAGGWEGASFTFDCEMSFEDGKTIAQLINFPCADHIKTLKNLGFVFF